MNNDQKDQWIFSCFKLNLLTSRCLTLLVKQILQLCLCSSGQTQRKSIFLSSLGEDRSDKAIPREYSPTHPPTYRQAGCPLPLKQEKEISVISVLRTLIDLPGNDCCPIGSDHLRILWHLYFIAERVNQQKPQTRVFRHTPCKNNIGFC